eukprot:PhF_6_TR19465/c0_g1_i1/m.28449
MLAKRVVWVVFSLSRRKSSRSRGCGRTEQSRMAVQPQPMAKTVIEKVLMAMRTTLKTSRTPPSTPRPRNTEPAAKFDFKTPALRKRSCSMLDQSKPKQRSSCQRAGTPKIWTLKPSSGLPRIKSGRGRSESSP